MAVGILSLVLLVIPGCCWGESLDKTGTRSAEKLQGLLEPQKSQKPAGAGSWYAEREGCRSRFCHLVCKTNNLKHLRQINESLKTGPKRKNPIKPGQKSDKSGNRTRPTYLA